MRCNICKHEYQAVIPDITVRFLPEFGEYENLNVQCPSCNSIEVLNMNIPLDDTDEPFATGDLPIEEEIQRYYVRLLMRYVREDLKS
jgi:rubredoxin